MKILQACTIAACAGIALSHPVVKRQAINDGIILNFALTLEYLEAMFYKEALANYTEADFDAAGFPGIRQNIVEVAGDEATHAAFLAGTSAPSSESNLYAHLPLPVSLLHHPVYTASPQQPSQ